MSRRVFIDDSSHLPDLLKTFQELINTREPGDLIIPKHVYDQHDTDSMISIGKSVSDDCLVLLSRLSFLLQTTARVLSTARAIDRCPVRSFLRRPAVARSYVKKCSTITVSCFLRSPTNRRPWPRRRACSKSTCTRSRTNASNSTSSWKSISVRYEHWKVCNCT